MDLTEKTVSQLKVKPERQQFYDTGGFGVRVEAKHLGGRASYFWRAKVHGRAVFRSLGEVGIVSLRDARNNAKKLAGQAATWKTDGYPPDQDPFAPKKLAEPPPSPPKCPAFAELVDAYSVRHVREHANNPERAEIRVIQLSKYLEDWKKRPIDSITVEDVLVVKTAQGQHRTTANRIVEFLRALFNWSAGKVDGKINFWKVENPAEGVSRYKEAARKRFLLPEELAKFNEALKDESYRDLRDFIVLALNTGVRRGDILSMRWSDLTWESQLWHIPKSKNGEGYTVSLLPVVMEVFKRRRAEIADKGLFVFPGTGRSGHVVDVKKRWQEFRKRAGVPDLRIHDLRRTCGSYLAMSGVGLPAVAEALGHKSLASTKVYAKFDTSAVREARLRGQKKMVEMMRQAQRRISTHKPKQLTGGR